MFFICKSMFLTSMECCTAICKTCCITDIKIQKKSIGFIFSKFGGHWSFVTKSGQLARNQFCALRGVAFLLEDESGGQPTIV